MDADGAWRGVPSHRRAGNHDLNVAAPRDNGARRVAERGPQAADLLRPAPREQAEHGTRRIEAQHTPGLRPLRRERPIAQRMADEGRGHPVLPEEPFLEGKDYRQPAHGREPAHTPRSPRPHLGRDIVQHWHAYRRGRGGGA